MQSESSQTCAGLLPVDIDHTLLLVLVAIHALLLARPVEGWPRVAARFCAPAVLDIHHALLRTSHLLPEQYRRLGSHIPCLGQQETLQRTGANGNGKK